MPDAHPLVEDEAAAVPAAVGLGHLFQIGEDAALQMDDLLDAFVAQESGRFFAADAAGAEHRDPLARETIGVGAPPAGKVAEAFGFGIDRAREAAVTDLEPVEIGRASCRERVGQYVLISGVAVSLNKKQ